MEKKLNECYRKMYELCQEYLPIKWTEVKIWAEKYSDDNEAPEGEYWDYHATLNYKDEMGNWHRSAEMKEEFSREISFAFARNSPTKIIKDIYKIFAEAGMERFKMFTYTVDAEGHFEVNFQYDYSQGEDFLQRLILWEYETIGFTGADFHKGIIKRYHPEADV